MFIGHLALGFAAKPLAPRVSLGMLLLGAMFADLVWPVLLLAGIETVRIDPGASALVPLAFVHYPISHSLFATLLWATLIGAVCLQVWREWRAAIAWTGNAQWLIVLWGYWVDRHRRFSGREGNLARV